ncbi:MAG: cupin domain-containing protein [Chloroflexia bacterium]|nr:cupin domain-containing protein [Chloroflexia bacterium]
MQVIRLDSSQAEVSTEPIFIGEVARQNVVTEADGKLLRVAAVTFRDGGRNKLHHHTTDQVLIVTDGQGIVATETDEHHVGTGDVIFVPAGERHWHGAEPGRDFTHLSVLTPGEMILDE